MTSLAQRLRQRLKGEVLFDDFTRALYSTDASIYRIQPLGVVCPRDEEEIAAVVTLAAREGVPILPRGAGTSLAGQAVGRAVVLDLARHMNRILEINVEERWARVQPGVVLDQLNAALRPHGLMYGPDVATSNRACVGGMIGNNSSGARSRVYGVTADALLEVRAVLADGSRVTLGPVPAAEAERRATGTSLEAALYREVPRIVAANRDEIRRRFPPLQRNVSGYALHAVERSLAESDTLDLARLVCGSEGTLAVVTEAKLRLLPRPRCAGLGVVAFDDLVTAVEATVALLETGPVAIELTDKMILNLAKGSREYSRDHIPVSGDPEGLLLVEYHGDTEAEINAGLDRLDATVRRGFPKAECVRVPNPADQAKVWKVRKAGVGILLGIPGDRKPIAFVEDTAVEPARLPEYVRRFREVVARHGTTSAFYGHASVGCLHLRPLIDVGHREDVERMKALASDVADLVHEFGGSMTGEHGDGLVRSLWIERMYGPQVLQAFREVKRAFDPKGILNPGKIVEAPPMEANLRPDGAKPLKLKTHLSFAREGGILRAVTQCSGVGICRKRGEGVMCPSFGATGDERHSTRGRANALRAVLTGELPPEALAGEELHEALALCLACKGCHSECPSSVDMARLKVEVLAHYYERHGTPLSAAVMGRIDLLSRLGSLTAPVTNPLLRSRPMRLLIQRILGVDARRTLPAFAGQTLRRRFARRETTDYRPQTTGPGPETRDPETRDPQPSGNSAGRARHASLAPRPTRRVALFADTFVNHNDPDVGMAAVEILERMGYQVELPERPCCGRAALSQGLVERARSLARANLEKLWPYVEAGIPIVGLEPSCVATVREEYLDLLDDERAERLAGNTLLLEELLVRERDSGALEGVFRRREERVWIHGHCHQKALTGVAPAIAALRLVPGLEVQVVDSGCCGMAGAFGYEHYDLSMAIGEERLFPALRALPEGAVIVAEGISCRQQIAHGTGRRTYHLAEVLRDSLASR